MNSARTLRFRLFLLAASGLVPLALAAVVALTWLVHERHEQAQRSALELSRALASAVDAELRANIAALQSVSHVAEIASERPASFHAIGQRIAASRGWRAIVVADSAGRLLLNTARPLGEPLGEPVDPASLEQALATKQPVIGSVLRGTRSPEPAFAVRVPVVREGGAVPYVLTGVVPAEAMLTVLQRQAVPANWVTTILDRDLNRVARSLQTAKRPSESLLKLLAGNAREGMGETVTVEGVTNYTGFTRLDSGWVVVVGVSRAEADKGLYTLLAGIAAGLAASLALSALLAWVFTRGVSRPIEALKDAAAALGAGQRVDVPPVAIAELEEVRGALLRAGGERDRLTGQKDDALRAAEEAGRSKDEFLAVLGHELRNPLAPISNALYLIERKGEPGTAAERRIIERQLGHMKRLVDDLLDVSRITGKRLAMQMKPMQLGPLVQHAADAVRPSLQGRELRVDIEPAAGAAWISGDEVRLAQVLNNLLGNAIKFTTGTGAIDLSLRMRADGCEVEVEVRDDGQGMHPEVLAHAFDLFYQAPQEADRARGGLGLGLAIVKSLVEMHGGSVQATSDGPGRGCGIAVRLPCVATGAPDAQAPPDAPARGRGRVLLVDDNQDAADTTGLLLEAEGYELLVVYTPQAALEAWAAFAPHVAVLDIGLPGMSGYELARRLRAAGFTGKLVAMTGYGRDSDVTAALDASFDVHLTKPVAPEELARALARLREAQEGASGR